MKGTRFREIKITLLSAYEIQNEEFFIILSLSSVRQSRGIWNDSGG